MFSLFNISLFYNSVDDISVINVMHIDEQAVEGLTYCQVPSQWTHKVLSTDPGPPFLQSFERPDPSVMQCVQTYDL